MLVGGSAGHIPELALVVTSAGGLASLFGLVAAQVSLLSSIMLVIAIGTTGRVNALSQFGWAANLDEVQ